MKGVAIVDFDNWFKKAIQNYTSTQFEAELRQIIESILFLTPNISFIDIRLYGGWYSDQMLTKKASQIQVLLSEINMFPYKLDLILGTRIQGRIEIVSSIRDFPQFKWFNTLKEKRGIPNLRINNDAIASSCKDNPNSCPPLVLKKFTKKKKKECNLEGCRLKHSEVFVGLEQKMVDTMIACDIISFCEEEDYFGVLVVSEDVDHFPAIAKGKLKIAEIGSNKEISVLIRNSKIRDSYDKILENFELKTILAE